MKGLQISEGYFGEEVKPHVDKFLILNKDSQKYACDMKVDQI